MAERLQSGHDVYNLMKFQLKYNERDMHPYVLQI